ncbi:MAG TPA: DUF4160 domain-containing protein [Bacteroidales bacterium]|nr:DUF4160 domain-containing protein [Bacteroidales bacterium]HSA42394.1 DUF4160 domain-containing protein [Bacteroidales bacterium]
MPEISQFYGIIILMNFMDHAPPHFHAWYGVYKISVTIHDRIVKGMMPRRALLMVFDWLSEHSDELLMNWNNAQEGIPLVSIDPLV